jgi:UDP-glucose 4-epimerase
VVTEVVGRPELEPEMHASRPGDVLRLYADSSKAADLLGWRPEISLREGLERLLAWHEEQGTDWEAALAEDVPHNWEVPAESAGARP